MVAATSASAGTWLLLCCPIACALCGESARTVGNMMDMGETGDDSGPVMLEERTCPPPNAYFRLPEGGVPAATEYASANVSDIELLLRPWFQLNAGASCATAEGGAGQLLPVSLLAMLGDRALPVIIVFIGDREFVRLCV